MPTIELLCGLCHTPAGFVGGDTEQEAQANLEQLKQEIVAQRGRIICAACDVSYHYTEEGLAEPISLLDAVGDVGCYVSGRAIVDAGANAGELEAATRERGQFALGEMLFTHKLLCINGGVYSDKPSSPMVDAWKRVA